MMHIGIYVNTYNEQDILLYSINQILNAINDTNHTYILYLCRNSSHHKKLNLVCDSIARHTNCHYYPIGYNRGVTTNSNEILQRAYYRDKCDIVLCHSPDVLYHEDSMCRLLESLESIDFNTTYIIGTIRNPSDTDPFASFFHPKHIFDLIGCLDENFFPAQYEEVDYMYRLCLATCSSIEDVVTKIVLPSREHRSMYTRKDKVLLQQQLHITVPQNQAYYIYKWGGDVGQEVYIHPFNQPMFNNHIQYGHRRTPYVGYNRTNNNIVQI